MAIARKNKDLADIFLAIVQQGKPVYLKDKELVENAIKSIKNLNCSSIADLNTKLDDLKEQFKKEMKNPENALTASAINNGKMDIYSMIQSLLAYYIKGKETITGLTIDKFVDFVSELLVTEPSENAVIVSSIHQVKGLEAKTVFIINYNLMPYTSQRKTPEDNIQEENLRYIAVTRAKEILYLCEGDEDEDEKQYRGDKNEINKMIEYSNQMYYDDYDVELEY